MALTLDPAALILFPLATSNTTKATLDLYPADCVSPRISLLLLQLKIMSADNLDLSTRSRSQDATGSAPCPSESMPHSGQDTVQSSSARKALASLGAALKSNAPLALHILQDAGELAQNIPYIQVIVGMMLKIFEMKEEVTKYREKWHLVIEDIEDIRTLIERYEQAFAMDREQEALPAQTLLDNLRELGDMLTEVERNLDRCCPKMRKRDKFKELIWRDGLGSAVDACTRKVQKARRDFRDMLELVNIQINMETWHQVVHNHGLSGKPIHVSSDYISVNYGLPAKPQIMHGRSDIIDQIIAAIVQNSHARVAILGPGGIGKTSVALTVLHHEAVQCRFKDACYFFSCEAVT
ncbi:hypothetical protein EWM64_g1957 [Hericium alpestre]|uniref:NB-ARC domain-containing protein n=1 Tax=Hericium alpestre TaxID=135208 RepID=A0A4Z0A6F5_9AGAM|nr:hypothetical protein EWM64_g1957 [Hericium alpestre]